MDGSGAVLNNYSYTPWGAEIESQTTETVRNNVRYAGYQYDNDLKQYYLWARMYSPYLARFNGYDPVRGDYKSPLTLNPYLYCLNDPVNRWDPSGRFSFGSMMSSLSIRAGMTATSFFATYGMVGAEAVGFMFVIDQYQTLSSLAAGIDPDTGGEADFTSYAWAAVAFLPGDEFIPGKLSASIKNKFRKGARRLFEIAGKTIEGQIHHRIPLEWAHLFPKMNPNSASNLIDISEDLHIEVNKFWTTFRKSVSNPTAADVKAAARHVDNIIEAAGGGNTIPYPG